MILSKSYKEVINKIHVDDAMKQRILQNIEQEQRSSSKDNRGEKNIFHYFQYKKLSVCAAVVVLLLCCVFYFGTSTILQPDTANQHNLASANKKDSLSARADRKEADSDDVSSDAANAEDEFNTGEESDAGSEFMDMLPDMNQYSSAKELSKKIGFTISDIPSSLIPFKISERTYSDYGAPAPPPLLKSSPAAGTFHRTPGNTTDPARRAPRSASWQSSRQWWRSMQW